MGMRASWAVSVIPSILILSTIIAVIVGLGFAISIENSTELTTSTNSESIKTKIHVDNQFGKIPLAFEVNQGQVDESVKFLTRGSGYTMFLTPQEAVISLSSADDVSANIQMKMISANPSPNVIGLDKLSSKTNYLISDNQEDWVTNVPNYAKVLYENIYPGIDLVYYGNQRQLEYDFIVNPGAEPNNIRIDFDGADELALDDKGNLILQIQDQKITQHAPIIYQMINDQKQTVSGNYFITEKNIVEFEIGKYNLEIPLVIDPILSYSTFLDQPESNTFTGDIVVDSSGNAYITGGTLSTDILTTSIQPSRAGSTDAFVTKINSAGTAIVYSTYLGGSSFDQGLGIAVDPLGNAYVVGQTRSANFPTVNPIQPSIAGSSDAFVTKINSDGDAIVYSTYFGGGSGTIRLGIAVDPLGNAYVVGQTSSANFPTVNPIQASLGGGRDAFVTKINSDGDAIVYSTYLGGSRTDSHPDIAVDSSGNAYISGRTSSTDFPTENALQPLHADPGGLDVFVTKINSDGDAYVYSTYLGGSETEESPPSIAVDSSGNAYISGNTDSTDFPTVNPIQASLGSLDGETGDVFVTKIDPAGDAIVYSTYLGGDLTEDLPRIAVDTSGNAYITGNTESTNFPTTNPIKVGSGEDLDFFVTKINSDGTAHVYSTYLGGSDIEDFPDIAVDSSGNAYVTGRTRSTDFPTVNPIFPPSGFNPSFLLKIFNDDDGIWDNVDTNPNAFSNDFEDFGLGGTSFGTILFRGGLTVTVTDAADPADGLLVTASGGAGFALINGCDGFGFVFIPAGTSHIVTCSSITIEVVIGPIDVDFVGETGGTAEVTLLTGDKVTFDPQTFTITNDGTQSVLVEIEGHPVTIGGSQTFIPTLINSDVSSNLTVPADEVVIVSGGVTISGNVKINGGTLIVAEGNTIKGNVDSKNGGTVVVSGSIVEGNIKGKGVSTTINQGSLIKGNVDSKNELTVIILDSTIDGNLKVNKAQTVEISENIVDGNLDVKKNQDVIITGNTVDGNLKIKNTTGSCTDTDNTVDGKFDGCP